MNQIAIIADIHSNLPALQAVLDDIAQHNITQIYALGDMLGDGPHPTETLDLIREHNVQCILGNREQFVLDYLDGKLGDIRDVLQMAAMTWTAHQLTADHITFLRSLPLMRSFTHNDFTHYINHASPDHIRELVFEKDRERILEIISTLDAQVYAYGHSHEAWHGHLENTLVINPGSVGLPFRSFGETQYSIIDYSSAAPSAQARVVQYDAPSYIDDIRQRMLPHCGPWCRAVIESIVSGEIHTMKFLRAAIDLAKSHGHHGPYIPNHILLEAERSYPWIAG